MKVIVGIIVGIIALVVLAFIGIQVFNLTTSLFLSLAAAAGSLSLAIGALWVALPFIFSVIGVIAVIGVVGTLFVAAINS